LIGYGEAAILGLLQGLTEFLPVSSSGHLVLAQTILGINEPMLIFDTFLHLGTLIAVLVVFWRDIWQIIRHPISKQFALFVVATIPVGIMGLLLENIFEAHLMTVFSVCLALIVTGILLWISDRFHGNKTIKDLSFKNALLIGAFQGVAVIPGLSRSGSTIFGSLFCGLDRQNAAKFSFILSIPAILGACGKQLIDLASSPAGLSMEFSYIIGVAVAAVAGYLAIRFFIRLISKGKLKYFSIYCWLIAVIGLINLAVK